MPLAQRCPAPPGRVFLVVQIIVAFLLWAPGPVMADGPEGRIEGVVTNLTTGAPPEGSVDVIVNGWMVVHSGRDGEWNITGLAPGEYMVELGLPAEYYTPAQDVITVTIWGDNTEIVNLGYYQVPSGYETDGADRVAPLGATATPAVVATETVSSTAEYPSGEELPGITGAAASSWSFWAVIGGLMAVISLLGVAVRREAQS